MGEAWRPGWAAGGLPGHGGSSRGGALVIIRKHSSQTVGERGVPGPPATPMDASVLVKSGCSWGVWAPAGVGR